MTDFSFLSRLDGTFYMAARLVVERQEVSILFLKTKLGIVTEKAKEVMSNLQKHGIITKEKPRKVLVKNQQQLIHILKNIEA